MSTNGKPANDNAFAERLPRQTWEFHVAGQTFKSLVEAEEHARDSGANIYCRLVKDQKEALP